LIEEIIKGIALQPPKVEPKVQKLIETTEDGPSVPDYINIET
jgi:hypothetical protein